MKSLRSLFLIAALFALALPPFASAADVSVTAANFQPGAGAKFHTGIAGATITAGQLIAISASTGRFVLADANDVNLCQVIGIAAHAAINGQPLAVVWYADNLICGATLSMTNPVYVLSATAGGIAPSADLSAGGLYPAVVIIAFSTTPAATTTTTCMFRAPAFCGSSVSVVAP
jgi:hypothetical protein